MNASAIAAQAELLERAWSPPAAPPSGRLTAAIFAALRSDPELLELAAEIPEERLPPLLFLSSAVYLVGRVGPDPLQRSFPRPGLPQPALHPGFAADFRAFCLDHRDDLRALFATRRYQMSEVARCAHLLPALAVAAEGREIALLDLGTGAGFALHLDRYRYLYSDDRGRERAVGDPEAPVTIATAVRGEWWPPLPSAPPAIVARLGLDAEPVALDDPDVRDWLAACVPPEAGAVTRFERATAVALAEPAEIVRGDAIEALPDLVETLPRDVPMCLLDAYVHVFFTPAQQARFERLVAQLGRTRDLDWLSLDPLVPLGPGARRSVIGIEVPPAIVERNRSGGVFGALARLSVRRGRARRSLLALGHPGGAWLEWLHAARRRAARALVAALAVIAAVAAGAGEAAAQEPVPPGVQSTLAEITGKPMYQHSIWGYRVVDLETGAVLLDQNADKMFVTGSILKVYSTATALDVLGPDHRFRTPVYRRGNDLVLVASGDFSFGLRDRRDGTLGFNSAPEIDHNYADTGLAGPALLSGSKPLAALNGLAREVRRSGIRRVRGDVVIDDRLFETFDGWPDGLMAPIWVNENVIDITTRPTRPGRPAKVDWRPKTAALRVVSSVRTVRGEGTPLTVDSPRPGVVRIRGRIGRRSDPILSIFQIPDPAAFARTAFIEALRRAGVRVSAKATGGNPTSRLPRRRSYPRRNRLAQHVSPPLSEYVKAILKVSYNRGADNMVCLVAVASGSRNCVDGLSRELATITRLGVSPQTTILFDGAGSSEYDRSSLADYTTFLRTITGTPWGATLRGGLPILGVDGTFATNQRGTPAAGHVFVKSGTRAQGTPTDEQGILSALTQAGYIDAASGRKLAYAMFLRDLPLGTDISAFAVADTDQGAIAAALQQGY